MSIGTYQMYHYEEVHGNMLKLCEYCGSEFAAKRSNQRFCDGPHYEICPICSNKREVNDNDKLSRILKYGMPACSYKCRSDVLRNRYGTAALGNSKEARDKAKQTMLDRYGVEYAMQSKYIQAKSAKTMIDRYGVDNAAKSDELKLKREQTCIQRYGSSTYLTSDKGKKEYHSIMQNRYGVSYPAQNSEIKEKIRQTNIERYGTSCYLNSDINKQSREAIYLSKYGSTNIYDVESIKEKRRQTCLARYGFDNPSKSASVVSKIQSSLISKYGTTSITKIDSVRKKVEATSLERYGVPYYVMLEDVSKSSGRISKINMRASDSIRSMNIDTVLEYRVGNHCYDIYVPSIRTCIEINPTYTHNLLGNHWTDKGLPIGYHTKISKQCIENGYDIYSVFDWDDMQSMLKYVSEPCNSIPEPKQIYKLTRSASRYFLSDNGNKREQSNARQFVSFGIVNDRTIYAAISIKYNKQLDCLELAEYGIRYGYRDLNMIIQLINFAKEVYDLDGMVYLSEGDRIRYSELVELGFSFDKFTQPKVWMSKNKQKTLASKSNYSDLIDNGWLPIEDSGFAIFRYHSN